MQAAESLSKLLESLGTQVEAARIIGCSQASISSWIRVAERPRGMSVRAIALATGRTTSEIVDLIAADWAARMVAPAPDASLSMGPVPCPETTAAVPA